jgi:hypothetical protein
VWHWTGRFVFWKKGFVYRSGIDALLVAAAFFTYWLNG